jgi:hypothetical protein
MNSLVWGTVARLLRQRRFGFLVVLCWAVICPYPAMGVPVDLSPSVTWINLDSHASVLRDPEGLLTITEITSPQTADKFTANHAGPIHVAGDPARTWVRFTLRDRGLDRNPHSRWILELNCSVVDLVELYVPDRSGNSGYRPIKGTRFQASRWGKPPFRNYTYILDPPSHGEATYYLRLGSFGPSTVPLVLRTQEAFAAYAVYDGCTPDITLRLRGNDGQERMTRNVPSDCSVQEIEA